jgi:hypothetical protein
VFGGHITCEAHAVGARSIQKAEAEFHIATAGHRLSSSISSATLRLVRFCRRRRCVCNVARHHSLFSYSVSLRTTRCARAQHCLRRYLTRNTGPTITSGAVGGKSNPATISELVPARGLFLFNRQQPNSCLLTRSAIFCCSCRCVV